jgi:hypothetical protein
MKKGLIGLAMIAVLGGALSAKVIATVNGYPITSSEANEYIKMVSKGKIKSYTELSAKDRKRLIDALATDKFVVKEANREVKKNVKKSIYVDFYVRKHFKELMEKANKELSRKEKETAVADIWLRKKASSIKVSDKELKEVYRKNKKLFVDKKTGKAIPYSKVKPLIKMQLQQKKYVERLMKHAKIDYNPSTKKKKK